MLADETFALIGLLWSFLRCFNLWNVEFLAFTSGVVTFASGIVTCSTNEIEVVSIFGSIGL